MIKPPKLKDGDKVAIISTARKIDESEIKEAIEIIKSWNLDILIGSTIGSSSNQFAGSDQQRISDMQQMLDDETVKAIFFARGGYGTVRIIDRINFHKFLKYPKWIVGYSDITVLHSHIHRNFKVQTIHASMPINFKDNTNMALTSLKKILFNGITSFQFTPGEKSITGQGQGLLVGGNLSILYSLMGSPSDIETKGKLLFIEDIDEYLYHIDRMMMGMERAGKLSDLSGLIVGGMTDMNDNDIPFGKSAEEVIFEHTHRYDYPVCFGFPAGHIADNRALLFGEKAVLRIEDKQCTLELIK